MKILFNTFILLIIVINICYAQGSFEYYNDLNKYLESLEIDEKDRNYYRKNVFSPERIEKINYSIE